MLVAHGWNVDYSVSLLAGSSRVLLLDLLSGVESGGWWVGLLGALLGV